MSVTIRQLPEIAALDAADVLPIDDVSNTGSVSTRKVSVGALASYFGAGAPAEGEADEPMILGQPVYTKANTHIALASSADAATSLVSGIVRADLTTGFAGAYSFEAIERNDWLLIAGTSFLVPGTTYFVALTPGMITPSPVGPYIVPVGIAQTERRLLVAPYPLRVRL